MSVVSLPYRIVQLQYNDTQMIEQVFSVLNDLSKEYPNFYDWYFNTVVPGLINRSRYIFAVCDGDRIIATMILKSDSEKKICTLRVSEEYRKQGIGSTLLHLAFRKLSTEKPLITVSSIHLLEFNHLLSKNGFVLTKSYRDYYRKGFTEYSYNGLLNEEYRYAQCC